MAEVEVNVNYSVKELLAKMDTKLDVALTQMISKADADRVQRVEARTQALEDFKSRVYGALALFTILLSAGAFKIFTG